MSKKVFDRAKVTELVKKLEPDEDDFHINKCVANLEMAFEELKIERRIDRIIEDKLKQL